jgi:hypothetical protein
MAGKRVTQPYTWFTAEDISVNFTSPSFSVRNLDNVGIAIRCTSVTDNTGEWTVEATSDPLGLAWFDLEVTPALSLADADEDFTIHITGIAFDQIRVVFTAAGTIPDGVATAYIQAKTVGV